MWLHVLYLVHVHGSVLAAGIAAVPISAPNKCINVGQGIVL